MCDARRTPKYSASWWTSASWSISAHRWAGEGITNSKLSPRARPEFLYLQFPIYIYIQKNKKTKKTKKDSPPGTRVGTTPMYEFRSLPGWNAQVREEGFSHTRIGSTQCRPTYLLLNVRVSLGVYLLQGWTRPLCPADR